MMPVPAPARPLRLLFLVNEAYFFLSHRIALAKAAQHAGYSVHVAVPDDHVWAPVGFTNDDLRAFGFEVHIVPFSRRGTNLRQELASFLAVVQLLRRVRPDLLHAITIKPVLYGGLAARLFGVPGLVLALTGLGQAFIQRGLPGRLLKTAISLTIRLVAAHRNARVIFQNRDDLDTLCGAGTVSSAKAVLIRGSGVPLHEYSPQPEADGLIVFVLPARLLWEKGVGVFVDAAQKLRHCGLVVRCALVGDTKSSNPRAVPEETLRAWVAAGDVEWWGRREDMPAVYAASHVVVLPSTYGEGVPRALIEAAACARAIITTDHPGCREIVRHCENGLLVKPHDADALAAAMAMLAADADMRQRMGLAGRRMVEREFSEDFVVDATLRLYDDLLGRILS